MSVKGKHLKPETLRFRTGAGDGDIEGVKFDVGTAMNGDTIVVFYEKPNAPRTVVYSARDMVADAWELVQAEKSAPP